MAGRKAQGNSQGEIVMLRHYRLLLGVILMCAGFAASAAGLLPAMDFARHPPIRNPVISPDGKHLAVSLTVDEGKSDAVRHELAIMQLPSLRITARLGFAAHTLAGQMVWVGDKRLLVSEARESGSLDAPGLIGELVAIDADGKNQRVIYSFLDRGKSIRAQMNILALPRAYPDIAGLPRELNGHVFLSFSIMPENTNGQSHDAVRTELYDVDTATGKPTKVARIDRGDMSFLVHKDRALFAYGADDEFNPLIYARDAQGGWTQLDSTQFGKEFRPLDVAPDDTHLYAMYSAQGGPVQLVETDLSGAHRKLLAGNDFGSVDGVLSTPRNARQPFAVAFTDVFDGQRPAVTYLDDSRWTRMHQQLMRQFPDFFIDFAGMSRDGSVVLVHAYSGRDPGTWALLDTASMRLTPLFQTLPWIKAMDIGERKPIRFKNRGGTELAGYLTLPRGGTAKNLPLVLIPHGGPLGPSDAWTYDSDAAFLANRGYAVLQINYRGSGGRGFNFLHSGYGQFASGIQDDLIDGVKWTIAQGYVDPNRIGVYGGSFGGYSALMQPILAPDLYKAAIDYVGVSDWTIEFDRADTRRTKGGRIFYAQAIGNETEARAQSPITLLDMFNVPVLIVHGGSDPRVPIQNADVLRDKLEKMGKPYEWLVYPKEGHGFYTEEHREALYQKMEAFLGRYLGGGASAEPAAASSP